MKNNWQEEKIAQNLWDLEVEALKHIMPDLYGHYLLQLSAFNQSVIKDTSLRHHFFASHRRNDQLIVDYEALPFRENSVDCVVAHHIFDHEDVAAQQCLREASRIVVPNGYLVIIGFNPYSTWGFSRLLAKYSLAPKGRYISQLRLLDWMALLGFRVEQVSQLQYSPPAVLKYFPTVSKQVDRLLRYVGLPGAGVYILLARKLVAGRTPIRPQWRGLGGRRISVASPSVRGISVSNR